MSLYEKEVLTSWLTCILLFKACPLIFTSSSHETLRFEFKKKRTTCTSQTFLLQWNIIPHCPTTLFLSVLMIFCLLPEWKVKLEGMVTYGMEITRARYWREWAQWKTQDLSIQGFYSVKSWIPIMFKHCIQSVCYPKKLKKELKINPF